jgi:hypothetical protein
MDILPVKGNQGRKRDRAEAVAYGSMLKRREIVHLILLVVAGNARGDEDGCFLVVHTVKMP